MNDNAFDLDFFIPEKKIENIQRTTHLGIGAHYDDLEIMASHGIIDCYDCSFKHFGGVICTDGAGSSRTGEYSKLTDNEMAKLRLTEQNEAAVIGKYNFIAHMGYSSNEVKMTKKDELVDKLCSILLTSKPDYIYTHNFFDKHKTHVAVASLVIEALRKVSSLYIPKKVWGCEVWRGLDWLSDEDKVVMNVSANEEFILSLLSPFKSQVDGGKRYDLATIGRMRANATYFNSHSIDLCSLAYFAIDLGDLIKNPDMKRSEFIERYINKFKKEVIENNNA